MARPFQQWVGNRGERTALYWRRGRLVNNGNDVEFSDGRLLSSILQGLAQEGECASAEIVITVQAQLSPRSKGA